MSLRSVTSLGLNLASITDSKRIKLHKVYAVISGAIKPLQLIGQAQSGGWGLITTHHCPQFWRSKKNSNATQFIELYFGVSELINLYNPMVRLQSSSLSPSFSPANQCLSSGNHFQWLFEKTIEGFNCKINGQALGAALQHSLGGLDGRSQAHGVS